MTFNYVEHYPDGYTMATISAWRFLRLLLDKRFELFIQLPKGGTLWIRPYFRFRYEKPSLF